MNGTKIKIHLIIQIAIFLIIYFDNFTPSLFFIANYLHFFHHSIRFLILKHSYSQFFS